MQAQLMQREDIEAVLEKGIVELTFEKRDGTVRQMLATTNLDLIPKDKHPIGFGGKRSETAKPVFDIEENGWRSFRWNSLLEIKT